MNLMSITAKDIDMAVPISTASHLRFFIFFAIGFFAIDVVSFLLIYSVLLFYSTRRVVCNISSSILYLLFKILFGSRIHLSP